MNFPDSRGWAAIGLFVMFGYVFTVCALNPAILNDKTIDAILMGLATGGVLLVAAYYFGSSHKDPPAQ